MSVLGMDSVKFPPSVKALYNRLAAKRDPFHDLQAIEGGLEIDRRERRKNGRFCAGHLTGALKRRDE